MVSIKQNYRLFSIKMPSFFLRYARSLDKNKIKEYFLFFYLPPQETVYGVQKPVLTDGVEK